jgi:bifunctional DNase/RNase
MIEVKITSISLTQVGFAVILRNDEDERVVPIFIGPLETDSISSVLSGSTSPRPKSHDLMVNILNELEANILRIVITELKDNTFYALLHLKTEKGVSQIDSRPSDAIALALRVNAPIFIEEDVLEEAGIILSHESEEGLEEETKEGEEGEPEPPQEAPPMPEAGKGEGKTSVPQDDQIAKLRRELSLALDVENYEEAARIRDQIKNLKSEN